MYVEQLDSECTYAERVTTLFKRIYEIYGIEVAETICELIRGVSMLDESVGLLENLESLDGENLNEKIVFLVKMIKHMRERFKMCSIYEMMEKVKEGGRTKLMFWTGSRYVHVHLEEEALKQFPWSGEIRGGGPNPGVEGILIIGRDIRLEYHYGYINLNGKRFNYWMELQG